MAESNATQVILTDDGIKIIKAQNTADNAAGGVANLNDPNLMNVIEKQNNVVQFASLTSQYNVIIQNAKDNGIDTTTAVTAYNNLNQFMADVLVDPDHASDVDRVTYKKYQDVYNQELAKLQSALQNNTKNKFTSAASATSQAASTANAAKSAADSTYNYANSEMAVQSNATAKAQSAADNAFSQAQAVGSQASAEIATQSEATLKAQNTADSAFKQAQSAIDYTDKQIASQASAVSEVSKNASEASSQANGALDAANSANAEITNLKDGSTLTIAKLEDGLGTKVDNGDFSAYKTQTASQFAETVKEADFKTYQTQTSKLIESKVDNGIYQSDKTQTANDIASKVSSGEFNTYKTQTADLINDKVSSSEYASDKTQTASEIADRVSNSAFSTYQTQTASQIASKVDNGAFSAYQQTTADLIAQKVATSDFSAYQATTAKSIESKVESSDFNTYKTQAADLIDDKVSSSEYASDKTQTASEIADRVSNSAFSTYQTQTASQIASKVDNSDFSTYKTQTADLISSKVATKDFNTYVSQTATAIDSKVASSAFDSYKQQTADAITSKVSTADFSTYKTQTATDINLKVSAKDLIDQINIQAGNTLISSSGQLTLSGKNIYFDTSNPVIIPSANIDSLLVDKKLTAADISANTFTTNNGTFTVDKYGAVVASNLTIRGVTNLVYNAALLGGSGSSIPGWTISNNGCYWPGNVHDGVPSVGFNSTATGWTLFAQTKLVPLNGVTGQPFSASAWFKDFGSDTSLKYQLTLAFFDSSGNRIYGGPVDNSWNGASSNQGWTYKTINNAVAPSNAASVGLQYWAYNGKGNAEFSSPMLTQTAQATGYQPDTGNIVSAGEINGSVINGSTINGTTFNAGDIINSTYNTSQFYPTTITPAGLVATTGFNSMDGLRTEMSAGSFITKYRAVNSSSNQYEAYDGVFSGDELALNSGFTNGIDMGFQQSVSGNQLTGQVVLSPLNGIHLWGSTQAIHFSGLQMNGTGVTINSYGNILADQGSTWWRIVDFNGNQIANFGTDTVGSNPIQFNRELDIGNFQINTGHTFTSADKRAIHFAKGGGGVADIYAGEVHYDSLVKSSLLSVKRDVKKADTAYWAQLVNSIDLATYQYKTDDNTSHIRLSSIVDDVNDTKQWQLPDVFISRDENGKLIGVDDSVLLNAILATVQEQQKEIDQLNGHNMELEAKLNKLEAKLNG